MLNTGGLDAANRILYGSVVTGDVRKNSCRRHEIYFLYQESFE